MDTPPTSPGRSNISHVARGRTYSLFIDMLYYYPSVGLEDLEHIMTNIPRNNIPKHSMYAIYDHNIDPQNHPHVGIHGASGICLSHTHTILKPKITPQENEAWVAHARDWVVPVPWVRHLPFGANKMSNIARLVGVDHPGLSPVRMSTGDSNRTKLECIRTAVEVRRSKCVSRPVRTGLRVRRSEVSTVC